MFNQFRVLRLAWTGKLRQSPTIHHFFWVFATTVLLAWLILAYNAFMSLQFHRALLEELSLGSTLWLPILSTILLALTIYSLMNAVTGFILSLMQKRRSELEGHRPLFVSAILAFSILVSIDVYCNLHGVDHVAKLTTEPIAENVSEEKFDKLQVIISQKESTLDQLLSCKLKGYCWRQYLNEDGKLFQKSLSQDIASLREQQATLMAVADTSYKVDVVRHSREVALRSRTHTKLVWLAYPLAILLTFISQHYIAHAIELEGNALGSATDDRQVIHIKEDADSAFLKKWQEAVELILAGHTNQSVIENYRGPEGRIGGTTIQKLKTVLRSKGILPTYSH